MLVTEASRARDDLRTPLADPDAAVAYRSLESVLSVCGEPNDASGVQPLVRTVLRSYLRALAEPCLPEHRTAWATFVRAATLLYFALDRLPERHADACWRQAALTLQQIALENADLLIDSQRGETT